MSRLASIVNIDINRHIIIKIFGISMYKLIINKTSFGAFDSFNDKYSAKTIDICPILKKIHINVVSHSDSFYIEQADFSDKDLFAFYINKEEDDASSTYAEIIVNEVHCSTLKLTDEEKLAALAHEIGHIIIYFREDKKECQGQAEEIYSDLYVCKMGLGDSLCTLIHKMINSGEYPNGLMNQMKTRLKWINTYI